MKKAILSMGSNLGDRKDSLNSAIEAINLLPETSVERVSSLYETEPFGVEDSQPLYLNCCAVVNTSLSPCALLGACLGIEAAMGRKREGFKSARVIDIDLLLYEGVEMDTCELTLPHPRMLERAFVLVPLYEIFPDGQALGLKFIDALNELSCTGITIL